MITCVSWFNYVQLLSFIRKTGQKATSWQLTWSSSLCKWYDLNTLLLLQIADNFKKSIQKIYLIENSLGCPGSHLNIKLTIQGLWIIIENIYWGAINKNKNALKWTLLFLWWNKKKVWNSGVEKADNKWLKKYIILKENDLNVTLRYWGAEGNSHVRMMGLLFVPLRG